MKKMFEREKISQYNSVYKTSNVSDEIMTNGTLVKNKDLFKQLLLSESIGLLAQLKSGVD